MRTVHQICELSGVTARTLQYYDKIGLLPATEYTSSGYRLYDDSALETLFEIMLFKELGYKLEEIKAIIHDPKYDRKKSLEKQIDFLEQKKTHLEELIGFAKQVQFSGVFPTPFAELGMIKFDSFLEGTVKTWNTDIATDLLSKALLQLSSDDWLEFCEIFTMLLEFRNEGPNSIAAQTFAKILHHFILEHMGPISNAGFRAWGDMYRSGGDMATSFDRQFGEGSSEFIGNAICFYCDHIESEGKTK